MNLFFDLNKQYLKESDIVPFKPSSPRPITKELYLAERDLVLDVAQKRFGKNKKGIGGCQLHQIIIKRLKDKGHSGYKVHQAFLKDLLVKDRRREEDLDRPVYDGSIAKVLVKFSKESKNHIEAKLKTYQYFYDQGYQFGTPEYDDDPFDLDIYDDETQDEIINMSIDAGMKDPEVGKPGNVVQLFKPQS